MWCWSRAALCALIAVQNALLLFICPLPMAFLGLHTQVELSLVVGEVEVELRVSPLLATLLLQFRGDESLTAAELAAKVRLLAEVTARGHWQGVGKALCPEVRVGKEAKT